MTGSSHQILGVLLPWRLIRATKPGFANDRVARGRRRLGGSVKKIPNAIPLACPAQAVDVTDAVGYASPAPDSGTETADGGLLRSLEGTKPFDAWR
jgi:hypothetical protein